MTTAGDGSSAEAGWAGRVCFADGPDGFACRPCELIVPVAARDRALELIREFSGPEQRQRIEETPLRRADSAVARRDPLARFLLLSGMSDPLTVIRELRSEGIDAQPNHVFFAHCEQDCCCGPHPSQLGTGWVQGSPVYATRARAAPVYATPVYATPVYATPVYATGEAKTTGKRRSSVKVIAEAEAKDIIGRLTGAGGMAVAGQDIDVVVLDTGFPRQEFRSASLGDPDPLSTVTDAPDADGDNRIDPVAGHGEFIAGLVKSIVPQSRVAVVNVLAPEGDGDEVVIAQAIDALGDVRPRGAVLNLSFGGYLLDGKAPVLASAIRDAQARGWVVVASAGNDATCRRTYPAALPDVVGVGAVGPDGPAPFTNYGPWVRACAPGVDLVSTFFTGFIADAELGECKGWAKWSGTSFSAPIVAGTIILEMRAKQITAQEAVARLIDAPGLLRLSGLGTVVNRV